MTGEETRISLTFMRTVLTVTYREGCLVLVLALLAEGQHGMSYPDS